jgi:LPS sulfotransferase NodH
MFVCTSGRAGSWLLCRALLHNGIGIPHEYFNPRHFMRIGRRLGLGPLTPTTLRSESEARRAYLHAIVPSRTLNAIFSAKIHWGQYSAYLNNPEGDDLLEGGHFIHLYREDLLGQVISTRIAVETDRWGYDGPSARPPKPINHEAFDPEVIEEELRMSAMVDANWREMLALRGVRALQISYEQLVDDLPGVLHNIVDNFRLEARIDDAYVDSGPDHRDADSDQARASIREDFLRSQSARRRRRGQAGAEDPRPLRTLDDQDGFVREALAAHELEPERAEPLYELARFYRERGKYETSALFAEAGMNLPHPGNASANEFAHSAGLLEEYSIAANYCRDSSRKERGRQAGNALSLSRDIPAGTRGLARYNIRFYAQPIGELAPSFVARRIEFNLPGHWLPLPPSVARRAETIVTVQPVVAARPTEHRRSPEAVDPIPARNYLLRLDEQLGTTSLSPIRTPLELISPPFSERGPFDLKVFVWRGKFWCIGCVEEGPQGGGLLNRMIARIDHRDPASSFLDDWRLLLPDGPSPAEGTWIPAASGDDLRFIQLCDPTRVLDQDARIVSEAPPPVAAEDFRGGSPAIAFADGWLAVIHQLGLQDGRPPLHFHRFVWFDGDWALGRVSRQFFFNLKGVEIAAGLTWHVNGRDLLVSYGVQDSECWIARVSAEDVLRLLDDAEHLPRGGPAGQ